MSSSVPSPVTVLEKFDTLGPPGTPVTTPEVADEFDCSHRTIYNKLDALVDDGSLKTKKVGARGRVWWWPPHERTYSDGGVSSVTPDETTERTRQNQLHAEQTRLLERIATGTPLEECLSALCSSVSRLNSGVRASILLADDEREAVQSSIAPDLASSWGEGLEGAPINELMIGTCGEAVCNGTPVTCENVQTDDRWADDWREVCVANGVMAGHSEPIQAEDGDPLGSFMLCFDEPRTPTEWEQQLADVGTHIASIAIERDQSRRVLRESEERLRLATDAAEMGVWELDLQTNNSPDRSPRHDEIFGYEEPVDDWSLDTFLDHVHPEDRDRVEQRFEDAFETGEWTVECRIIRADDNQRWIAGQGEFYDDDAGKPVRAIGTIEDITERKETEQERRTVATRLKAQKEAFQAAADGAPLGESLNILLRTAMEDAESDARAAFYRVDDDGSCLHPIAATSDMPDAYIRAIDGFEIGADSLSCGLAAHTGQPVLTRDVTEEPLWEPLLHLAEKGDFRGCWSFPIETGAGDVVGTLAMYHRDPREATPRDQELAEIITQAAAIIISRHNESEERKQAEQALRESEERQRLALEAGEMGVWELDLQTNTFTDRSSRYDEIFGYEERNEWSFDTFLDHVHPDDRNQVAASFENALQTGDWSVDCRIIRADDEQRWITASGEVYDDEGEPVRAIGTVQDITERKQRARELREQSELEEYGAFVRAVEDYAIFMLNPDGDVISWNDGAERIKGYTKDDIVGEHFSAFYTAADSDEGVPKANLETAATEGRVEDEGWRIRKDGSRFWADVVITAIRDDNGTLQGFTKVTRDRTEQREYELDETDRTGEPSGTEHTSVKDEQVGTYMYLPDALVRELNYQFKLHSAEYEHEIGQSLEKNRHWYPLLLSLGLDRVTEMDPSAMQAALAEMNEARGSN